MTRVWLIAAFAALLVAPAAALPPDDPLPGDPLARAARLASEDPAERAEAAVGLASDPGAAALVAQLLATGDPASAREICLALADRPEPRFALPLASASRRPGVLAEAAVEALDALGRRRPADMLDALRAALASAALEERAEIVPTFGFVRSERAIPDLVALLPGRDAEPAMSALRRLTTLPFTEPRDWDFWWEQSRTRSLEEILRDANRRLREENSSLKTAIERETARANELEKERLREALLAARGKKDVAAERAILEKELANPQAALRAWAAEEVRQATQPADLLPTLLRLAREDSAVAVRVAAIRAAGVVGKVAALGTLRACLADADPAIREAAVGARTECGGEGVVTDILPLLDPAQPRRVRESVVVAFKTLKPRELAAEANRMLEGEWKRPAADSVAAGLIELLGVLRDPSSVAVLVAILRESADKTLRFRTVRSLGEIRDPAGAAALIAELDRPAAEQEKDIAAEAVSALAKIGGDEARRRLETALTQFFDNPIPRARENAARGLQVIGSLDSVAPLMKCANSEEDKAVKQAAWEAALALSDAAAARLDALEALLVLMGPDTDPAWRIAVRRIVVKAGNFDKEAARVAAHRRPLGDDLYAQGDWVGARAAYEGALAGTADDVSLAARVVACRTRGGDHRAALDLGEKTLEKVAPGSAAWVELRRAMIESRSATQEFWRALALVPHTATLAGLPQADREWLGAQRPKLEKAIEEQIRAVSAKLDGWAALDEAGKKAAIESLRAAPPVRAADLVTERARAPEAAAAVREVLKAGFNIEAAEGAEGLKKGLEALRTWAESQVP